MAELDASPFVFLSFASSDRPRALALADALDQTGVRVWIGRQAGAPGTTWPAETLHGISDCGVFLVLCSHATLQAPNVQRELRLAIDKGRPLLPVLLESGHEPVEIHDALAGRRSISVLHREAVAWLPELLDAWRQLGPASTVPTGQVPGPVAISVPATGGGLHLPAPVTSFIGREGELAQVTALLSQTRLLTLVGAPGVGKTRLALNVAAAHAPLFPDGVFFVDLSPLRDADLIPEAVAQALALPERSDLSQADAVLQFLRHKRLLLVLDNHEHLRAGTSFAAALLQAAPAVTVLVTSRARLRIPGERAYTVPLFPLPAGAPATAAAVVDNPAVALFVARAQAARSDFRLTDANAADVTAICTRLDGLPLAIELAAARVRLLPVDILFERLGIWLTRLVRGTRDAPLWQRTLGATIAWSYDLLGPEEQAVFARLAVFQGGCTLDAAETVCASEAEGDGVLEALASLREHSLVQEMVRPEGIRLRLLETIREFAVEQLLGRGEDQALRRRHAECYLTLAEEADTQIRGPERVRWTERLHAERENIRAALAWCAEAGDAALGLRFIGRLDQWYTSRFISDGLRLGQAMLALPGAATPTIDRGRALSIVAAIARAQGRLPEARGYAQESAAVCRALGDAAGLVRALTLTWYVEREVGREDDSLLAEILELARASRDAVVLANALLLPTLRHPGTETALAALAESYRLAGEIGDPFLMSQAVFFRGRLALLQDRYTEAVTLLERSLVVAQEFDHQLFTWLVRPDLIIALVERGDVWQSLALCETLIIEGRRDGVGVLPSLTLDVIAGSLQAAGEVAAAAGLFGAAEADRGGGPPHYATAYSIEFVRERTELTRRALGARDFDLAFARGRLLPFNEAIAQGLRQVRDALPRAATA